MSYHFSEMTTEHLEDILTVFDAVNATGKLLIDCHVIEPGAVVDQRDLVDAIMAEMTRRAHVDAGRRVPALRKGMAL